MNSGEPLFGDLFEDAPIAMFRSRMDGSMYFNKAFREMVGYSADELRHMTWREVTHPEDVELSDEKVRQLMEGVQKVVRFEKRFLHKNGSVVWAEISSYLQRTPAGEPDFLISTINDLSRRKAVEAKLRESENRMKIVLNASGETIFLVDEKGTILAHNETTAQRLGQEGKDMTGHSIFDYLPGEPGRIRREMMEAAIRDKKMVVFEDRRGDHWIENHIYPVVEKGKVAFLAIYANDITNRRFYEESLKKREDLLISILESTGSGILVVDNEGVVSHVNQMFGQIWDMPPGLLEELNDEKLIAYAMQRIEDPEGFLAKIRELNHTDRIDIETLRLINGRMIERISYPLVVKGKITGRVWGFREVTQLQRAEDEIRKVNAELKELNATKDKFFSIIAHDLKNPFNSIIGFSELLQENARDLDFNTIEQYASIMNSSARHASELLENLLVWARIQQGNLSFNPKVVNVGKLIDKEWQVLKNNALQKNLNVSFHIPALMIIRADENMVGSCVRNLLANAIKFTPGGGKIQVDARLKGEVAEISFRDSGVGIDPASLEKLFRIETSFTTRGTDNEKGTGLGLLLVKEFVQMHEGTVSVKSLPGEGSTFLIRLPVGDIESAPDNKLS
jgi:PAS domain S-box-containing protein